MKKRLKLKNILSLVDFDAEGSFNANAYIFT